VRQSLSRTTKHVYFIVICFVESSVKRLLVVHLQLITRHAVTKPILGYLLVITTD